LDMELEHSFTIPAPSEQAWPVLLDVERVAPCLPGATVDAVDGDVIKGRLRVKIGPVALTYSGTARFVERDMGARSITLEASGKETRGAGTASATIRSSLLDEGGQTRVVMRTTLYVKGRPAQFGRGVMAEVGDRIIKEFAANLAAELAGGQLTADLASGGAAGAGKTAPGPAADPAALGLPIEELNLPVRAFAGLKREGIRTLGELSARTENDLLMIEGLGPQSVREIKQRLAGQGLQLATPAVKPAPPAAEDATVRSRSLWRLGRIFTAPRPDKLDTVEEYDAVVSYGRADAEWVRTLAGDLERQGLRVYRHTWELMPADLIAAGLQGQFRAGAVVFVVSQESVGRGWANQELIAALEVVADRRRVIPVLVGAVALPSLLASRLYIDFRHIDGPAEYEAKVADLAAVIRGLPKAAQRRPPQAAKATPSPLTVTATPEAGAEAPARIFLSYRREETGWAAGRLFDRLSHRFGRGQIFKDVDAIQLGDDFVEVITSAVASCDVLLALIGDRWLTITDRDGHRRLDDDTDFVRLEIEAALTRNVRVIPILVQGARMPSAAELPTSMAKLVRRQALNLNPDQEFEAGVERLFKALDKTLDEVHKA